MRAIIEKFKCHFLFFGANITFQVVQEAGGWYQCVFFFLKGARL